MRIIDRQLHNVEVPKYSIQFEIINKAVTRVAEIVSVFTLAQGLELC